MAKQTGYMQITLREFDQSCIRNAPDDAFLQGFQLKAITASGEKADDTHSAVTVAGKVLCNVPAFFEIELAKQSFLYETISLAISFSLINSSPLCTSRRTNKPAMSSSSSEGSS